MNPVETVIVGAGPYGLSIAAHLKYFGLSYRIFGTPLESWNKFMPVGMVLKSEPFASNLWDPKRKFTFERYCAAKGTPFQPVGKPLSLARFLEYAEWFRQQAVGEVTDARITRIQRAGRAQGSAGGFALELADGTKLEAKRVILATGHMAFRYTPSELRGLPEEHCVHASLLHELGKFSGRDVTIVGAGQSALESAALLHEAGARVRVLVRGPRVAWNAPSSDLKRSLFERIRRPESGLGAGWQAMAVCELPRVFRSLFPFDKRHRFVAQSWGPSGAAWLRGRVEGHAELLVGRKIRSATLQGGRVRLEVEGPGATSEILTDVVIPATGYKVDMDRVEYLSPEIRNEIVREGTAPVLSSRFETSAPGLFVVGVASAPTFGPVMRFMFGAKHPAAILSRYLKSRQA